MSTEALVLYLASLEHRYQQGLITGCELAQAKAQAIAESKRGA